MQSYITDSVKVTLVQAALSDGQATTNSTSVDMNGFDGVLFVGITGTITGSGTVTLTGSQSADDSTFALLATATASVVATAAAESDNFLALDIFKPGDRYVRVTMVRAVANSVYSGTLAIQYQAREKITTQDATTLAGSLVQALTPAEA